MNSNLLKAARVVKGKNQDDIAKYLRVAVKTYCNKENGKGVFNADEIYLIAEFLELSVDQVHQIFFTKNLTKRLSKAV